jgi:hypothetical protein
MFGSLLGAIRADIDRQVDWARGEVGRQARYTALTGLLAVVAGIAALGAMGVGLIALYVWLTMQFDPLIALGIIGGGLLLLALILLVLALIRRRPRLALRPRLQIAQPVTLLGTLRPGGYGRLIASSEPTLKLASDTVRHGSRPALLGTLLVVALVGLIAGRRLQPIAPPRSTIKDGASRGLS